MTDDLYTIPDAPPAPSARFYVPVNFVEELQRAIGSSVMEGLVKLGAVARNDNAERITREERKALMEARVVGPNYENIMKKLEGINHALDPSARFYLGVLHIAQFLARDIQYLLHWGDNPFSVAAILRQYFEIAVATHCWALDPEDLEDNKYKRPKAFASTKVLANIRKGFEEGWLRKSLEKEYKQLSQVAHPTAKTLNMTWEHKVGESTVSIGPRRGWEREDFEFALECFRVCGMLLANATWKLVKFFAKEDNWNTEAVEIKYQTREEYLKETETSPSATETA